MKFTPTEIPDVVLIEPEVFGDERGYFMETWHLEKFSRAGISDRFMQSNQSKSEQRILRGLHYQIKHPQGKLVHVISGAVFDVAVDLRRSSPSFGQWVGKTLTEENKHMLWVPPGFAHGFYVISDGAEFVYQCTDTYYPEHERCIRWDSADLGIEWPLPKGQSPILSEKDRNGELFNQADYFDE